MESKILVFVRYTEAYFNWLITTDMPKDPNCLVMRNNYAIVFITKSIVMRAIKRRLIKRNLHKIKEIQIIKLKNSWQRCPSTVPYRR